MKPKYKLLTEINAEDMNELVDNSLAMLGELKRIQAMNIDLEQTAMNSFQKKYLQITHFVNRYLKETDDDKKASLASKAISLYDALIDVYVEIGQGVIKNTPYDSGIRIAQPPVNPYRMTPSSSEPQSVKNAQKKHPTKIIKPPMVSIQKEKEIQDGKEWMELRIKIRVAMEILKEGYEKRQSHKIALFPPPHVPIEQSSKQADKKNREVGNLYLSMQALLGEEGPKNIEELKNSLASTAAAWEKKNAEALNKFSANFLKNLYNRFCVASGWKTLKPQIAADVAHAISHIKLNG